MKEYAKKFYKSKQWQHTRQAYASSVGGLCERCLAKGLYVPGDIVHHKIYIDQVSINNPDISLNWNNLELVCRECHAQEHKLGSHRQNPRRYVVDQYGHAVGVGE